MSMIIPRSRLLRSATFLTIVMFIGVTSADLQAESKFPEIVNSQPEGEEPTTPEEAAEAITVPEGFQVTLFAGEPDVAQPISMQTDDRGRLWVVECYTYAKRGYSESLRDRIVILEDTDHDGRHDERTVFWDQGDRLTSVLPGTDGCWILNSGTLAWLADADGDDKADGEPKVYLNGFNKNEVGHNIVNGLMYGPTGWIYARHGIQATSHVGPPGAPPEKRRAMNCSIWRFHPEQHRFEVVTEGTTNPWGLDYNRHGDFFFTNNVIGHGWHAIPGAHFKRMYGADFNSHFYELIDQHADHYHWDQSASWSDSREAVGIHGKLGGGHSHCGGMIYQGDNWPEKYRGHLYMCNTHGRRVNCDHLVRKGSGYVMEHGEDFLFANQPWFRGVDLKSGPDGEVYLSDWTDLGECHDHDGVHRTSGRIYRITYGEIEDPFEGNLQERTNQELVDLAFEENQWFSRHARRILQDRKISPQEVSRLRPPVKPQDVTGEDELRVLWLSVAFGILSEEDLVKGITTEQKPVLRSWAVRLLSDQANVSESAWKKLIEVARKESSAYVRLSMASAMQKMPLNLRVPMAKALTSHREDVEDHNMRLLIWYGLEPAVPSHPGESLELTSLPEAPKLRSFIARRLMHEYAEQPNVGDMLTGTLLTATSNAQVQGLLEGMLAATRGVRQLRTPENWSQVQKKHGENEEAGIAEAIRKLSVVFGDGRAIDELLAIVRDGKETPIDRITALQALAGRQEKQLLPVLKKQVNDRAIAPAAVAALARYQDEGISKLLIKRMGRFKQPARQAAVETLCSRPSYARELLSAMKQGRLSNVELSASQVRQLSQFGDESLSQLLEEAWGTFNSTPAEKQETIARWKEKLTPDTLAEADRSRGRHLFDEKCANCHRLFGQGKELAPDLTGGDRRNLDYLLENLVTPSALVPNQYKVSTFVLASGRVINGVIQRETDQAVVLQTEKEEIAVSRDEIEMTKPSKLSLMPEGLLDKMSEQEVRDLVSYLQADSQVRLPRE